MIGYIQIIYKKRNEEAYFKKKERMVSWCNISSDGTWGKKTGDISETKYFYTFGTKMKNFKISFRDR